MKKESVLHIPMSQYAHGISESRLLFRLRTAKNDLEKCCLYYGDTACRTTPITFYEEKMSRVSSDEFFDYYEVEIESRYHRVYYYFALNDGRETYFYYSDFFRKELVDDRSEYYKIPFNRREDIAVVPKWVKDSIVYNIFPDSFATGKRYVSKQGEEKSIGKLTSRGKLGGTIRGIEENIDYLKELGITCIYINPIFCAGEYHKYDTFDYFRVDPCFGTNEEFKKMVEVFHAYGIQVMIDGVFNHVGWNFYAFEDVVQYGEQSEYKDWFYGLEFPVVKPDSAEEIPNYECFAYERMMPKLNTSNPQVMEYLIKVGVYWVREFDIDGWRLDVASEVDDNFWREFRKAVKKEKEDCFIIGEVWENAQHWLDGSMFDSTMNYDLRKHCMYFFAKEAIDAAQFDARVSNMRMRYKKNLFYAQLNLLDSHDVSRFLTLCEGNREKWQLAILFQMLFIGIPCIFYGDEQEIQGTEENEYRKAMEWNEQKESYLFYKKVISLRKDYEVLKSGAYAAVCAKKEARLYGFERFNDKERIMVFMNAGEQEASVPQEVKSEITKGRILWKKNADTEKLQGYGFLIIMKEGHNN